MDQGVYKAKDSAEVIWMHGHVGASTRPGCLQLLQQLFTAGHTQSHIEVAVALLSATFSSTYSYALRMEQ